MKPERLTPEVKAKKGSSAQSAEEAFEVHFFTSRTYPQTAFREFKGLAHAELVMMFPERFANEVNRFLNAVRNISRWTSLTV